MKTVILWRSSSTDLLGSATFNRLPVTELADFRCEPNGLVTFAMAQRIAAALDLNETSDEIDALQWKIDSV